MVKPFADVLMSAEVDALCGAEYGERGTERINSRNGYRNRDWDTRAGTVELAIPKLRSCSYFPDWLLQHRRRAEQALASVIGTPYLLGVSTQAQTEPSTDQARAERRPSQARAKPSPSADRAKHGPSQARTERGPSASRAEREPSRARAEPSASRARARPRQPPSAAEQLEDGNRADPGGLLRVLRVLRGSAGKWLATTSAIDGRGDAAVGHTSPWRQRRGCYFLRPALITATTTPTIINTTMRQNNKCHGLIAPIAADHTEERQGKVRARRARPVDRLRPSLEILSISAPLGPRQPVYVIAEINVGTLQP
ncbi:hypothetical protein Areg01_60470 [Actinoplanes regularis]|nr:hypothetical protein Areg01_60470 [Actinoplanes regularis]